MAANGMMNRRRIEAHLPAMQEVEETEEPEAHPLDSEESQKVLDKLRDWWYQAQAGQRENRAEMAKDEAYYDGEQWEDEERKALEKRGQAPLVFNRVKPTVDWVLGTERQMRVETTVLPRRKEESELAKTKAQLLKYISDVNKLPYHQSRAFSDAVKVGVGWLEHGVRDDETEELIYDRYESWRNMWYDHLAVELDGSDARYLFRSRWVDLELAQAMFPDRAEELEREAHNTNRLNPLSFDDFGGQLLAQDPTTDMVEGDAFATSGNSRLRVRLVECWYRKVQKVPVLRAKGRPEHGAIMQADNPAHSYLVDSGVASTVDSVRQVVWCAIFSGRLLLQNQQSPYRHNRFPFSPVWCYRRGRDNAPYGMIRNLRDPQQDLNKRASKSLYILSTNRIIADSDATDNWKALRAEADRPDGVLMKKRGSELKLETDRGVASDHMEMMDRDSTLIKEISGVPDESRGEETNATSGVAVNARANHGMISTAVMFDNLYAAMQSSGELRLSLVEQFYDEEKVIRVVGESGKVEFVELNTPGDDGGILNPLTETQADYVVSQQDYRATMRQAMFDAMLNLTAKLDPEVTLNLLDLVVDLSDLPGREEMVARIRQLNGQQDPAADPEDPANIEREEKAAKAQALEDRKKEAEVRLIEAQGKKADQEAVSSGIGALYSGIQTAQVLATMPAVAPLADAIAKSAGFMDRDTPPIYPATQEAGGIAAPVVRHNTDPRFPPRPLSPQIGVQQGIETPEADGMMGTVPMPAMGKPGKPSQPQKP